MFRILYRRGSINHIQSIKTAYIRKTDTRMQLFVWFINWPSTLGLISDIYSVNSHSFGWVSWTEWVIGSDINTTFSMYTCATFKQAVWAYIECTHLSTSATGLRMVHWNGFCPEWVLTWMSRLRFPSASRLRYPRLVFFKTIFSQWVHWWRFSSVTQYDHSFDWLEQSLRQLKYW